MLPGECLLKAPAKSERIFGAEVVDARIRDAKLAGGSVAVPPVENRAVEEDDRLDDAVLADALPIECQIT